MNTIKATAKIAGFLLVVLLALGCGGPLQPPSANTNQPTPTTPTPNHASSKFLHVVNSIEKTVQGFAIDAPMYAAATPDGKFLYVANAGTKAIGVSAYRIDGLRGSLMPTAPAEDLANPHLDTRDVGNPKQRQKQIPFGNDKQKSNSKGKVLAS